MNNDLYFMRSEEDRELLKHEDLVVCSRSSPEQIEAETAGNGTRFSWPFLAAWLLFGLGLGWFGYSNGFSLTPPQPLQAASIAPVSSSSILKTERIADLKVGLRVLAQNPETPGETPTPLEIPDPTQWRLFTLEQTKKDGGILRIELLRRVDGVASAVLTEEELLPPTIGLPLVAEVAGFLQPAVRLPARTVAFGADLGWKLSHTPNLDKLLIGKTLDLNLPEMGAVGEAKIVGISRCPEIEKGQGRVITGRFIHRAANVVDLLISGEEEPIGTTDNHPFWSEDRREYVPAGELRVGENLRTVNGSRTYVQSIRPRGPPEDVYNLEVEGAHTYHVGTTGVLVHNSCTPKGGTYRLIDDETGEIVRTGRTNDLVRRRAEHARSPELGKYRFDVVHRTDDYATQRGLEHFLHLQLAPRLNKIGAISNRNPNIQTYINAALDFLSKL